MFDLLEGDVTFAFVFILQIIALPGKLTGLLLQCRFLAASPHVKCILLNEVDRATEFSDRAFPKGSERISSPRRAAAHASTTDAAGAGV